MFDQPYGSNHDTSVLGLSRIRKYPERFRHQRRSFLRTSKEPGELVVSGITGTGATVTWSNVETDLTGLRTRLERRVVATDRVDDWTTAADFTADNETTNMSGMLSGALYECRLYHYDEGGPGRSTYVLFHVQTAP